MGHEPTPSRAAIKGHPIHPMLVTLPIGMLTSALVADVGYAVQRTRPWASGGTALLGGVVVTGLAAGAAGLTDFLSIKKIREHKAARIHGAGNGMVVTLSLANLLLRLRKGERAVLPWGLVLTATSASIVTYTGWLGGELSYKHMFGVNPHQASEESPLIGSQGQQ